MNFIIGAKTKLSNRSYQTGLIEDEKPKVVENPKKILQKGLFFVFRKTQ